MKNPLFCTMLKPGYATFCVLVMTVGAIAGAWYAWRLTSMTSDLHERHLRALQLDSVAYTMTVVVARRVQQNFESYNQSTSNGRSIPIIITSCLTTLCPPAWHVQGKALVIRPSPEKAELLVRVMLKDALDMQVEGRCLVLKQGKEEDAIIILDGLCTGAAA